MWEPRRLTTLWASTNCYRDSFTVSRYSDWLRVGQQRRQNSNRGRLIHFLLSTSCRPLLGLTQPPIQWVPGAFSPGVQRPWREAERVLYSDMFTHLLRVTILSLFLCRLEIQTFLLEASLRKVAYTSYEVPRFVEWIH
jgi:hypothetical protein